MNRPDIEGFITRAIAEDLGDGDHTSMACIPAGTPGKAKLLVKEEGILSGLDIARQIFEVLDKNILFEQYFNDGDEIRPGDIVFRVSGSVHTILKAERLVLNIMQRMCGIATTTNKYVRKLEGLKTRVLDTRKTTPGIRFLEKEAVRTGGGTNYRMGLYDMIMIKDNHIDYAGSISRAIDAAGKYNAAKGKNLFVVIEARTLEDVQIILEKGGINRIMLDNFSPEMTKTAVELINGKYETESSGGITLETIREYAECGVDYISVGALTHHIKSLDLSLKAEAV